MYYDYMQLRRFFCKNNVFSRTTEETHDEILRKLNAVLGISVIKPRFD